MKENIEQYKPLQELKVPQARLLLVGQVGAGKSSFFNTLNSIFRGYITSQACSGNAEHSLTTVVSNTIVNKIYIHVYLITVYHFKEWDTFLKIFISTKLRFYVHYSN